jgi:hypothetical protein
MASQESPSNGESAEAEGAAILASGPGAVCARIRVVEVNSIKTDRISLFFMDNDPLGECVEQRACRYDQAETLHSLRHIEETGIT